jgi:hypothetical protein
VIALALLLASALGAASPALPDPARSAARPAVAGAEAPKRSVRVERRLLVKRRHAFIVAGPGLLARGDYYTSPGVTLSGAFYPLERGGIELRLTGFVSRLDDAAREVQRATGLVPDAHRPRRLLSVAWRQSVAYGKLAASSAHVLHFDVQLSGAAGLLSTDRATAPALAAGPGVLFRLGPRAVAQLDVLTTASFEPRVHAAFAPGLLVTLGVGAWL